MTSLTYLVVNGLAGLRGTQLEWFISASHASPPVGLTRLLPMLVWEFQRAAKENKLQCISPFWTFTCVTFAKIPLAKASCMAKVRVSMAGITKSGYWNHKLGHIAIVNNNMKEFLRNRELFGKPEISKQKSAGGWNIKRVAPRHFFIWYP